MTENEHIKNFLSAMANDDYVEADKQFPNVVKSSIENLVNNKKPLVVERLNAEAEKIAAKALDLTNSEEKPEEKK